VKIIEGIRHKGCPFEIPDCSRLDLPKFFAEMGYEIGAEIGVYKGEYTKHFCEAGLKMYGIDPWTAQGSFRARTPEKHRRFQERQDFLYGHTQRVLKPYLENGLCTLIRKRSLDALADFEDRSLDFVYVDANHGFRYVAEDICEWVKKVKRGGVISGHDYTVREDRFTKGLFQVKCVVDAYTRAFDIESWYLLGSLNKKENEKRDKWRSWIWINL